MGLNVGKNGRGKSPSSMQAVKIVRMDSPLAAPGHRQRRRRTSGRQTEEYGDGVGGEEPPKNRVR